MKVVLFDGECNFCSQSVQFIIKRDKRIQFKFASLQSTSGRELVEKHNIPKTIDSVVLVDNDRAYTKSSAVLRIALGLDRYWKLLYVFLLVPVPLRNIIYDIIAKNRHKLLKQNNACMVPSKEDLDRFI
ncbi:thiol-disulfide oxidoreductase DCC family protein [Lysinibacillus endophyticus]|uniref:thiol-disulfide oxidoreductase DCC family protein n=1 Tax=Ureibacillus endophyticus TaxID=1978490 RepID=UPI00209E238E|nr:DCC1-like thiol-disulfide oxidoreductase family protein [Lysinibacillus endophyticus]MCP1145419.1 DCC1-like thiol-disulfide oxidoreductase family protein [Lysinibacillus endophyticus]